jgi:hypothetical protein
VNSKGRYVMPPVPADQRCQMQDYKGVGCQRRYTHVITYENGVEVRLCRYCSRRLHEWREKRPEVFGPITVRIIP